MNAPVIQIHAPAKINLYLHINGRRDDGYHLLDSLVGFCDIGDVITITPSSDFQFDINGPFADQFGAQDKDTSPASGNLVIRAAHGMARLCHRKLAIHIQLTKNLPLASGIGGASSDAAATVRGLWQLWGAPDPHPHIWRDIEKFCLSLGADVPVCLHARPVIMRGIGDELTPLPPHARPPLPVVLINPLQPCPTPLIFKNFTAQKTPFSPIVPAPPSWASNAEMIAQLRDMGNDLLPAATAHIPAITDILHALAAAPGCALARLSGSGATCIGVFDTYAAANHAAQSIQAANPAWWNKAGALTV